MEILTKNPWTTAATILAAGISLSFIAGRLRRSNKKARTRVELLDSILNEYKSRIGTDFEGYKNHCYRVFNLFFLTHKGSVTKQLEDMLAIAIALHDIGLWTEGSIDYIDPSVREAEAYLSRHPQLIPDAKDRDTLFAMIDNHHKLFAYTENEIVEAFRKADWMDATQGMRTFGVVGADVRAMRAMAVLPAAGFYGTLVRFTIQKVTATPFENPLPMFQVRPRVYSAGVKRIL